MQQMMQQMPMLPQMQMPTPKVVFVPVPVPVGFAPDDLPDAREGRREMPNRKGKSVVSRKVFVGGLRPESTAEQLRCHFEKFGEIADCVVINRAGTKECRGFGFVEFVDDIPAGLFSFRHTIDQRRCAVRPYDYSVESA